MSASLLQQILAAIEAETAAIDQITVVAQTMVEAAWRQVKDPNNPTQVKAFLDRVIAMDLRSRQQIAGIADAYMRHVLNVLKAPATGRAQPIPALPRGIPMDVQWRRPINELLALLEQSIPELEAAERALRRAETIMDMDLRMAARDAHAARMAPVDKVIGYRRVIHPERMTVPGKPPPPVCGLCLVASDRLYKSSELEALHDHCRCTVVPVIDGSDIGSMLNRDSLNAIYREAGGTDMKKLKRLRVAIRDHAELGPLLVNAEHHFRGPKEVGRDAPDLRQVALAELENLLASVDALLQREAAGEDVSGPLAWQRDRIEALRELTQSA